jgi:branched-chain amino acid transport system ATP-binding protein
MAVALALEPELLLLDEPMAGMSPEERWQMVDLVKQLWERLKITMVFIRHDMDMVFGISQRSGAVLQNSTGRRNAPGDFIQPQVIEALPGREV